MTPEERALLRQDELDKVEKWMADYASYDKSDEASVEIIGNMKAIIAEYALSRLAAARAGEREMLERCTSICNQQLEAARQLGMFAGPLELARNNLVKLMAELFPVAPIEEK